MSQPLNGMTVTLVHGPAMPRFRFGLRVSVAVLAALVVSATSVLALQRASAQVARPLSGGSDGAAQVSTPPRDGTATQQPVAAQTPLIGTPTIEPGAATPAPMLVAWSPPPPTPEDVRGLPPCPPGAPRPAPGELYTCRPHFESLSFHGMLTVELAPGWVDARGPVMGSAFAFAAGLDIGLTRAVALGFRYAYLTGGDAGFDGDDEDSTDDENTTNLGVHLLGAGPRFRLFTDETAREAWSLELDGGYAYSWNDVSPSGAFVRVGIGRQIGMFIAGDGAAQIGLQLSYYQGLGVAADLRGITFGVRLLPEWGVPEPKNIDTRPESAGFAYTLGMRWAFFAASLDGEPGIALASGLFGLTFGLPVNRWFEPRVQGDISYIGSGGDSNEDAPFHYTGLAGFRLRGNGFVPMYLEAMAGWTHVVGTAPIDYRSGVVVDVGLGLNVSGCGGGGGFGVHYRFGVLAQNERYDALMLVFSGEYGSERGALAGEAPPPRRSPPSAFRCGGEYSPARVATPPYLPPPAPPPPPPPPTDVNIDVNGRIDVELPDVRVDVRIEPVTVEVTLGLALFGGAVRMDIDVRSLPLAQIRNSGFVSVQLIGPPAALPRAEAELRAALGPDGASVSGFAAVAAPERMDVRAIFTIWPPGSRPPGQ